MKDFIDSIRCRNGFLGVAASEDHNSDLLYINGLFVGEQNRLSAPVCFGFELRDSTAEKKAVTVNSGIRTWIDRRKGIARREAEVEINGHRIQLCVETFASMAQRELAASRITLSAKNSVRLQIAAFLHCCEGWNTLQEEESEDALCLLCNTRFGNSRNESVTACASLASWSDEADFLERSIEEGALRTVYEAELTPGNPVHVEQYVLCFTDAEYSPSALSGVALRSAARSRYVGFEELLEQQANHWMTFWNRVTRRLPEGIPLTDDREAELYALRESVCLEQMEGIPMLGNELAACWMNTMRALPFYFRFCEPAPNPSFWFTQAFDNAIRADWALQLQTKKHPPIDHIAIQTVHKAALLTRGVRWAQKQDPKYGQYSLYPAASLCLEAIVLSLPEETERLAACCLRAYLEQTERHSEEEERMRAYLEKHPVSSEECERELTVLLSKQTEPYDWLWALRD